MYKYTALPGILHSYDSAKENSARPWDACYYLALGIVGTPDVYFACGDFWRHYRNCEFYSPQRRKTVPLNGVLIPVEYFVETKVDQ